MSIHQRISLGVVLAGLGPILGGAEVLAAGAHASGREAVASAGHAWKAHLHTARLAHTHQASNGVGPIPAHFGHLPATTRLAYLLARRAVNPSRFDRFHPSLGPILSRDADLRAAQGVSCVPMNGLLPDTAHSRYLHYRRNLNPTRFDHYHPALGALLAEDDRLRSGTGCVSPIEIPPASGTGSGSGSSSVGTPGSGGPIVGGGVIPPTNGGSVPPFGGGGVAAVPEPASLTLILVGLAGAAGTRFGKNLRFRRKDA